MAENGRRIIEDRKPDWCPLQELNMTEKKIKSCTNTIRMLRKLALNIHGVIDVIDNDNVNETIELLNMIRGL
jgi:hypothetical protein